MEMKATAGTADRSHLLADGLATANCAESEKPAAPISMATGNPMLLPARWLLRMVSREAIGTSSEMQAFAHPNQSGVPIGLLLIVQS
ncbi:hypothetical protein [Micromonospora sp. NBC_01412]|uniref:hypothetical protein n=1 Tax=Micromonospora sp. NBC_01412 TaxID=2903590 RepID=UPI00386D820E